MRYLFLSFVLLTACSLHAQQTADALIGKVIKITPRSIPKYDPKPKNNVSYLKTAFNNAIYEDQLSLAELKGKVIVKVELVYTTYRKSETFDQHALNRKRLKSLMTAAPQLLEQPGVEWILIAQTGCTSAEMGKEFFHGVAITYREPESDALRDAELKFLHAVAEGTVPAYAYDAFIKNEMIDTAGKAAAAPPKIKLPEFKGGERARIEFFSKNIHFPSSANKAPSEQVIVQFVIDKEGKIQHISLPGTANPTVYHEEVLRFMRTMPAWTPGTIDGKRTDCMVLFTVDFMERGSIVPSPLEIYAMDGSLPSSVAPKFDYSRIKPSPQGKFVSETLAKNTWKQASLVCDVTGSMAPYSAQVLEFLNNQFKKKDTSIVRFYFFNDGDNRKDHSKKVGSTGGIHFIRANDLDQVIAEMSEAMKAGTGGDLEENDIEALLQAEADCPSCTSTILIADNMASPRDMSLALQLKKPVHVIVCGTSPVLNADYMNLARMTKGTLHFNNRDYTNLHTFEEGATVQVGKEIFVVKNGRFVRRES
jgi:hypothetical protein